MLKLLIFTLLLIIQTVYAECSDLSQAECEYWSGYCQWNTDNNVCEEIGGGGDGNVIYGPYEIGNFSQTDGMQEGSFYADATIYYPVESTDLLTSIVLGPYYGGDQESMANWANYFASHGIVSATIQYDDPENDSHQYRAEAIIDLIGSIKLENDRINSPLYNRLNVNAFATSGISLSGGSVQLSAVLDSTLSAVVALNPTIITEDCDLCLGADYCICLVPEFLNHNVPTLIIAGQNEIDELPSYDGLLGFDQYTNTPESTDKLYYEILNGTHDSASYPSATGGQPAKLALNWLKYFLLGEDNYCDSLIIQPENASQFLTTISCEQGPPPPPPEHNLGYLRRTDVSICMDECGMYYLESEEGEFLTNITNQNDIPNFDNYVNRFVEIEGDTAQCVECSAKNVESIILSSDCQNPVSCFVDPCTVGNCGSSNSANCLANYCGDCFADFYEDNALISCETPSGIQDLSGVDFGDCEMVLGFGWLNNHCGTISGCSFVVDSVNYVGALYSSLFDCISASTLDVDELNPVNFYLSQNHPNPFNPITSIAYELAYSSHVKITIHDMNGRLIKTLVNRAQSPGYKTVTWNGKDSQSKTVAAGVYIYTIEAGPFRSMKKMVFLK